MKSLIDYTFVLFLLVTWIAGFVIAKGFVSTLLCIFPLYAWYLDVELMLKILKII